MIVFLVLLAFIAPIVVVGPLHDQMVLPKLAATAAFTGAALLWGALLLARDRWPAGRWPATVWGPVVAFVVVNVLAVFFAVDWRASLMGEHLRYQGLATTLLYVLLFAVTAVAVRTTRDLRWLLLGLFAGGLGAAIYALIQKGGLAWWPSHVPDRPGSTVGQANELGAFLVVATSASAFLVLTAKARWQRAAFGVGVLAMLFALFFTVSRSAYLAAGMVVVLWGVAVARWFLPTWRERSYRLALRVGVGAVAAAPLVLAALAVFLIGLPQGRVPVISEANSQAVQGRLTLWRMGLEMTGDRPLLGHGQDAFPVLFARYRDRPDLPGIGTDHIAPESAHNFFVDLAVGTGVLGLLAFLALVGAVLWQAGRRALATDDTQLRLGLIALGTGVVGYLVAIFFGFSEAMTSWAFWLLLGATAGLLARVAPAPQNVRPAPEPGTLSSGMAAVGLTLVAALALGWAATFTAADLAAGQAQHAKSESEFGAAARLAGRAVTLNPLQKTYLFREAQEYELGLVPGMDRSETLRRAIELYETLLDRFQPQAFDVYQLAKAKRSLAQAEGRPFEDVIDDFERAIDLDPYNGVLRGFLITLYEQEGLDQLAAEHRFVIWCWSMCD